MIISGLRTSCAMTVERRPSADRRSRCAASRWKRSDGVGEGVEGSRQEARVLVVPALGAAPILRVRSPVVAISRMAAVMVASGRVTVRATA